MNTLTGHNRICVIIQTFSKGWVISRMREYFNQSGRTPASSDSTGRRDSGPWLKYMCLLVAMARWGSAFTDKYFLSGEQNIFARFSPRRLHSYLSALPNNWFWPVFFHLYFYGHDQNPKERLWPSSGTLLGSFWGIKRWHEAKTSCHKHNIHWNPKTFTDSESHIKWPVGGIIRGDWWTILNITKAFVH